MVDLYPFVSSNRRAKNLQTGNNFVDSNKQHVDGNMLLWCKRGLRTVHLSVFCEYN